MTDTPQTAAGKALLLEWEPHNDPALRDRIVTIEQAARAEAVSVERLAEAMRVAEQADHGLFVHEHTHYERAQAILAANPDLIVTNVATLAAKLAHFLMYDVGINADSERLGREFAAALKEQKGG